MTSTFRLLIVHCALVAAFFTARAPLSAQPMQQPAPQLPPLMYVRFEAPKDMMVTLYPGNEKSSSFKVPFTVGLRPGYIYRVKLSAIAGRPLAVMFPTLEIRASLWLANRKQNAEFPLGLVFRDEDFMNADRGGLVTKVAVLEHPDRAEPIATKRFEPLQIDLPGERTVFAEAIRRGRPMIVLRMGQRDHTDKELMTAGIANTIRLPGQKELGYPKAPPQFAWGVHIPYNPARGFPSPKETTLYDGGDRWPHVAHDPQGGLRGFDPSDTIAEYSNSVGQRRIAVSNRVQLCIPRYIIFAGQTTLAAKQNQFALGDARSAHSGSVFVTPTKVLYHGQHQQLSGMFNKQQLSSAVQRVGLTVVGHVRGLSKIVNQKGTGSVTGKSAKATALPPPDRPLKIIKWPRRCEGKIGEVITFYIRVTNEGGQPVDDIIISDSLTGRFAYVEGSAQTNRQTVFTTQANDAGSAVLRWQFTAPLMPGQSGLVSFQIRVR